MADLLRSRGACTLTSLDLSTNSIGVHGGKTIYAALRQNEDSPIMHLDLRHSRFDKDTDRFLRDIASTRMPPLDLQL